MIATPGMKSPLVAADKFSLYNGRILEFVLDHAINVKYLTK